MPFINKLVYSEPNADYRNAAIDTRGRLINDICEMERIMDRYITQHFCESSEKAAELQEVIVSTKFMTFQGKSEIVQKLLEKRKDATKKEAGMVYDHLVGTIAFKRTILAHYALDTSVGSVRRFKKDGTITFLKYYHIKTPVYFTKNDAKELSELVFRVKQYFSFVKHWKNNP